VKILKSIFFSSPEVRAARGVLEELSYQLEQKQTSFIESAMFQTVKSKIQADLRVNGEAITGVIRRSGGRTPREWVYAQIGNVAGDLLESGQYHFYRGCLNDEGLALRKLFDWSNDELIKMGAIDPDYVIKQGRILDQSISRLG
jgi:hypothetical protein